MRIREFYKETETNEKAIEYLFKNFVFTNGLCTKCKRKVSYSEKKEAFRCNNRKCLKEQSICQGTFFENSNISIQKILEIWYLYFRRMPVTQIVEAVEVGTHTVCKWTKKVRNLITESISQIETKLGGPGIVVEIDETKLGKRKYHRGHRVDGVWIVCGVERTKNKKYFALKSQAGTRIQ